MSINTWRTLCPLPGGTWINRSRGGHYKPRGHVEALWHGACYPLWKQLKPDSVPSFHLFLSGDAWISFAGCRCFWSLGFCSFNNAVPRHSSNRHFWTMLFTWMPCSGLPPHMSTHPELLSQAGRMAEQWMIFCWQFCCEDFVENKKWAKRPHWLLPASVNKERGVILSDLSYTG